MERKSIVSEICDDADDFLAGVTKRAEAKAGIDEWLTIHQLKLQPDEKKIIIHEVMGVLEDEKFFEYDAGGND